jgi:ferredoxin/flavodoxin
MVGAMIYYFSGTGNTLFIAKELAALLQGELVSISSAAQAERICPSADTIGIVYPVYYGDLPPVVHDFAKKLQGLENKYIFAVSNYGGGYGVSMTMLEQCVTAAGGTLAAAYGIHMPQNAFRKFWENNGRLVEKSRKSCRTIAENTRLGKKGIKQRGILPRLILPLHTLFVPLYKKGLARRSGMPADTEMDVLVRAAGRTYTVNEKCTACGLCEKVCPVANIVIIKGRPKWQSRCENCLACYNWCPSRAIEGSVAHKDYYYVNPNIKAQEIMAQKS